jgi:tetratricopeptide (TPR) repeat protein
MATTGTTRSEARARLDQLLLRLERSPADADAAWQAADIAIDHGFEEQAWPAVARVVEKVRDRPHLWQYLALLHRGLDRHDRAIEAFRHAARLAPADRRIAHGLALTSLEGGLPAFDLFERALRLDPADSDIRLGSISALKAEGRAEEAIARLDAMLREAPLWIEGHRSWARINAALGTGRELAAIDAAIALHPRAVALHALRIDTLSRLASPEERLAAAGQARRALGDAVPLIVQEAIAASEAGQFDRADQLFMAIGQHGDPGLALSIVRHLVRAERFVDAERLAGRLAGTSESVTAWAYRHTAWRALDDPRLAWLDRGDALVRSFDIIAALPPLDRLADTLRAIHADIAQPLDQSVRGGTQTDGPLFMRIDPTIRALRQAVSDAVRSYAQALPPIDPTHPLLSAPRDEPVRFAGSWSVRLTGAAGGHHANHIHAMGWLSSALYVSLPPAMGAADGCLTIGAPPANMGLAMAPTATVAPAAGRLVLFPSHLWHGVTPFAEGERLTVAFDVARPRG